jgi:SM-20-related protein
LKTKVEAILADIDKQGWTVQKDFFPHELIQQLQQRLNLLRDEGKLKHAGVGREKDFHIEQSIRNDLISWFDEENLAQSEKEYLSVLHELQQAFNQNFYLGLFELEIHFALYSPNAFYKRHLDQHKDQDSRVLTVVTYLNDNWDEEDGGELCIYLKNGQRVIVSPQAGTFVCFFSADFEHEVFPAKRERASLTGWFRKRV